MPLGFVPIPMNSTFILTFKKKREIISTKTLVRKGSTGFRGPHALSFAARVMVLITRRGLEYQRGMREVIPLPA